MARSPLSSSSAATSSTELERLELTELAEAFSGYRREKAGVAPSGRRYPHGLVTRAVALVERGVGVRAVATALGVHENLLAKWRRKRSTAARSGSAPHHPVQGGGFVEVAVIPEGSERRYTLKSPSGFCVEGLSRSETIGMWLRLEAARCS